MVCLEYNEIQDYRIPENISTLSVNMDSTLIFTNKANFLAYQEAILSICYLKIKDSHQQHFNRSKLQKLLPNATDSIIHKIILLKKQIYHKYLHFTHPNKALISFLASQKSKKIILNTNASKQRVYELLRHHNLFGLFYKILCNKQDNKYQNLIVSFNLKPNEILVFEDEQKEITKAIQAGILKDNIIKIKEVTNDE